VPFIAHEGAREKAHGHICDIRRCAVRNRSCSQRRAHSNPLRKYAPERLARCALFSEKALPSSVEEAMEEFGHVDFSAVPMANEDPMRAGWSPSSGVVESDGQVQLFCVVAHSR
jgi:hypothetical protein